MIISDEYRRKSSWNSVKNAEADAEGLVGVHRAGEGLGHVEEILLFNNFFRSSIHALVANI